jgi:hypothetical protein
VQFPALCLLPVELGLQLLQLSQLVRCQGGQLGYPDINRRDVLHAGLWIRIRIGSGFSDFVDPDPYWKSGSGSRGKILMNNTSIFDLI